MITYLVFRRLKMNLLEFYFSVILPILQYAFGYNEENTCLVLKRFEDRKYWCKRKKAWVRNTALRFPARSPIGSIPPFFKKLQGLKLPYLTVSLPLSQCWVLSYIPLQILIPFSATPPDYCFIQISYCMFNTLPHTKFLIASQYIPSLVHSFP